MTDKPTSHETGLNAEKIAEWLLRIKGYKILAKRYKTPLGEIDIIAKRYGLIAFIEVKHRKTQESAAEAIDHINQDRVRKAAELYLAKHTQYTVFETRFDALLLSPGKFPQHIIGAF